ncbi:MAG: uroporphyrinogen-III C-methyltransferase [Armatimonadota bacterium]
MARGIVYLVGAGPGDPGLITLKGVRCLQKSDVIVLDRLASPGLLDHARADVEVIYVGKQAAQHTMRQEQINQLLVDLAREGKVVTRLKGGDPFVFGRGGEEAEALAQAGAAFEIVPGVTSLTAAPAYAGIPVTHRGCASSVALVTGHEDPTKQASALNWEHLAQGTDTICFAMGMGNLPEIAARLIEHGRPPHTPVALVRWGTTPRQEVLAGRLDGIARQAQEAGFKAPAIILVGEVARLRGSLRWFDDRPLFGKRIVVTRTRAQASELVHLLREQGAEAIEFPVIRIVPPESYQELDAGIARMDSYDWLVFTSPNAIDMLLERCHQLGRDIRALGRARICALGPATARSLEEKGLRVDLVPDEYIAEAVAEALGEQGIAGKRVLLARARAAREVLPERLREMGAEVDVAPAYETVLEESEAEPMRERLRRGEVDAITFTSSSTVRNFVALIGPDETVQLTRDVLIACIGPITAQAAEDLGLHVGLVAEPPISDFVQSLVEHYDAVP